MNFQFLSAGQFRGRDVAFFLDPQQQVVHAYPIVGPVAPAQSYFAPTVQPPSTGPAPYYGPQVTPAQPSGGLVPEGFNTELPPEPPRAVKLPAHLQGVFIPRDEPGAATERRQV